MAELKSNVKTYSSDEIDITYDIPRCIHAAECVKRLSSVFDTNKRPWIQPEHATADEAATVIHLCPSGALHYTRKDGGSSEPTPDENTIRIVANGPVYVRGQLALQATDGSTLLEDTRIALCRCGKSENKPLCDNSHIEAGFEATDNLAANVGKSAEALGQGALIISTTNNGPLLLNGPYTITSSDGTTMYKGDKGALCRCGGSSNKPFCDGTHRKIGFQAE